MTSLRRAPARAVVDNGNLSDEIKNRCGRKLSGLDMEAYSVACINTIVKGNKELLVVKGISGYAKDKGKAETTGNKELAKTNSAKFAYELIRHLHTSVVTPVRLGLQ